MANVTIDTWKMTAIGLVLLVAAVGITTFVVGQKSEGESPKATQKAATKRMASLALLSALPDTWLPIRTDWVQLRWEQRG